jgi:hypothetical protein
MRWILELLVSVSIAGYLCMSGEGHEDDGRAEG